MLSTLELRHIIESALRPLSCECRVDQSGSLQALIFEPVSGRVELLVTGISTAGLNCNRAIGKLIAEIQEDLETTHGQRPTLRIG
ncbi:DUF1652 domain-containing protein [Pseudomonas sp. FP1740]|uniref:DUF1652 domain-containing protein n=1 Tax=Pseudomonas sp. FP1740 TaxID=2954078 RepID=UPI0027373933|nr:DUF1652 domain-containing protein [Pseudomonas sp. FP1740]WLG47779.1 DUF1652 domain-containing protein [Pseudomonas sp. FP1740]